MLLASMNAVDSDYSDESGLYLLYDGRDMILEGVGLKFCVMRIDEPEPEMLSPKGVNMFEPVDRS